MLWTPCELRVWKWGARPGEALGRRQGRWSPSGGAVSSEWRRAQVGSREAEEGARLVV